MLRNNIQDNRAVLANKISYWSDVVHLTCNLFVDFLVILPIMKIETRFSEGNCGAIKGDTVELAVRAPCPPMPMWIHCKVLTDAMTVRKHVFYQRL